MRATVAGWMGIGFSIGLLAVGGWVIRTIASRQTHPQAIITQELKRSENMPATEPASGDSSQSSALKITVQLTSDDAKVRKAAEDDILKLAKQSPKTMAENLADWRPTILSDGEYQEMLDTSLIAIRTRPFDVTSVQALQKARVQALLAMQNYSQALSEAKSFYNIATLKSTNDAIDLLVRALAKTQGEAAASAFKTQQVAGGDAANPTDAAQPATFSNADAALSVPAGNALSSISIDADLYASALASYQKRHGYNFFMGAGNLLILSDRPADARKCFQEACKSANSGGKELREALEGIARAMRDIDGDVSTANAFITAVMEDPQKMSVKIDPKLSSKAENLRLAAQQTVLAEVQMMSVPPCETERAQSETTDGSDLHIAADFDCATPIDVVKISPTHYQVAITTQGYRDWFMFHVSGVAGKTVRIDLAGDYIEFFKWWSLNPLYSYASNLDNVSAFATVPSHQAPTAAWNGAQLPATDGQSWHFISNVWREGPNNRLSFVQHFDQNDAFIAMRVPFTPGYNQNFFAQIAHGTPARVIQVGTTSNHRPLQLAVIGDDPAHPRPCVLIYAREHADEHDTSWAAQGALEFLISDDPIAQSLRQRFTFIVIPLLDPDSAAVSQHEVMMTSFLPGKTTPESIAWSNWFKSWIDSGQRLDLVFDFHNVQSRENPQVCCPLIEGIGDRGNLSLAMHNLLVSRLQSAGYTVVPRPWSRGLTPDRLGGWLSVNYGPFTLAYEFNSQDPQRHLNLVELKKLGEIYVKSATEFLESPQGTSAMTQVGAQRQRRLARWAKIPTTQPEEDAIESEAKHSAMATGEAENIAAGEKILP